MPRLGIPPTIHEEVRILPSKGAVTNVTPQNIKEKAKIKEFQLLDLFTRLKNGDIPDNQELLQGIRIFQRILETARVEHESKLSPDGQQVVYELESFCDTLEQVIVEKNQNERIQKLFFHSKLAATSTGWLGYKTREGTTTDLRETYFEGLGAVGTLLKLLVTNAHFRGLLIQIAEIARDVWSGPAYEQVLQRFRPGGSKRRESSRYEAQVPYTRASKRESVHSTSGVYREQDLDWRYSSTESERFSGRRTSTYQPYRDETERRYSSYTTARDSGIYNEEIDPNPVYWPYGEPIVSSEIPRERKIYVNQYGEELPATSVEGEDLDDPAILRDSDRYYVRIPSDRPTTYRTSEYKVDESVSPLPRRDEASPRPRSAVLQPLERIKKFLPDSSRRKLTKKIMKLLRDVASNPEYQEAIEYLFRVGNVIVQQQEEYRRHPIDANVFAAALEFKRLLESFANQSLTPLINSFLQFTALIRHDPHLKDYLDGVRHVLGTAIRDPAYLESDEFQHRLSLLMDRGRNWAYTPEAHEVVKNGERFMNALKSDHVTRSLVQHMTRLTEIMLMEESGRLTFKADLLNDVRVVFLPAILSQMKYIALPRIEHRDATIDLILDNLVLTLDNALPNVFVVEMINRAILSPRNEIEDQFTHLFNFTATQIQADIRDVSFYYRKHTFPKVKEWGVVDLAIAGQGIRIGTSLEYDRWAIGTTLRPLSVRADVDDLRVTIHHTNHDTLYKVISPVIEGAVRKAIITSIETNLTDWLEILDRQLTVLKSSRRTKKTRKGRTHRMMGGGFMRQFVPGFLRRSYVRPSHHHSSRHGSHRPTT